MASRFYIFFFVLEKMVSHRHGKSPYVYAIAGFSEYHLHEVVEIQVKGGHQGNLPVRLAR